MDVHPHAIARAFGRLEALCQRLGGSLQRVTPAEFEVLKRQPGFSRAPASPGHGLDWDARRIYAVDSLINPGAIIHEMGHVFASDLPPYCSNEFDWLGWEIVVARHMRCYRQWSQQNKDYAINELVLGGAWIAMDGDEWGDLSRAKQRLLARDRIAAAKQLGSLTRQGMPRALRRTLSEADFRVERC